MKISFNESWLILGTTGSGKSVFLRQHMLKYKNWIALQLSPEPKPEDDFSNYSDISVKNLVDLAKALKDNKEKIAFVIEPFKYPKTIISDFIDEISKMIYIKGKYAFVIDELSGIGENSARNIPDNLHWFATNGRKRYTPFLFASQRPQDVHKIFYDQSIHKVFFQLDDRLVNFIDVNYGCDAVLGAENLPLYNFIYFNSRTREKGVFKPCPKV